MNDVIRRMAGGGPHCSPVRVGSPAATAVDQLELQGLVMDMADEYMTGLGEALFQATDDRSFTPRQRRFTASIVRAGTLAAI